VLRRQLGRSGLLRQAEVARELSAREVVGARRDNCDVAERAALGERRAQRERHERVDRLVVQRTRACRDEQHAVRLAE
jgi:hypothetical protein